MRFRNLSDLSKLPYFSLKKNSLTLNKDILDYPIIDLHTHLGWHYGMTGKINLWAKREVRHFFPSDLPITLDHYSAFDFTPEAKRICGKEVVRGVYDTHGYSSTHTIPNLLDEMDALGVLRSVVLAIDYPVLSRNTDEICDAVSKEAQAQSRVPVFMSLHPFMARIKERLKKYMARGSKGIKLHTQMQLFKASDKRAFPIYDLAGQCNMPILFHTGLSPLAPSWQRAFVKQADFEAAFAAFPRTTFIIGHGGGMDGFEWAISMARKYEYVHIELSGQPPEVIGHIIAKSDTDKVYYGSDWPFYPMALPLAKTLVATEGKPAIRKRILFENADRLLNTHI